MAKTRTKQILLNLSEHELDMIDQKMAQLGIKNRSAYLRKMAIDGMVINLNLPEFKQLLSLSARTAANVNQIAARCNSTGNLYQEDVDDLRKGYQELREQTGKAVAELVTLKGIL